MLIMVVLMTVLGALWLRASTAYTFFVHASRLPLKKNLDSSRDTNTHTHTDLIGHNVCEKIFPRFAKLQTPKRRYCHDITSCSRKRQRREAPTVVVGVVFFFFAGRLAVLKKKLGDGFVLCDWRLLDKLYLVGDAATHTYFFMEEFIRNLVGKLRRDETVDAVCTEPVGDDGVRVKLRVAFYRSRVSRGTHTKGIFQNFRHRKCIQTQRQHTSERVPRNARFSSLSSVGVQNTIA
jgi:hypothetical protein